MLEATPEWAANGSPGTRGKCPVCSGTIYKQGRTPAHDSLPKPAIVAPKNSKPSPSKKKGTTKKQATTSKKTPKSSMGRGDKLVVVESPAKAKTIGRYLGRGYVVKSSLGHVRDLLKSRLSVDIENDFAPEYRVPNEKRALVKELKEAAARSSEIFLATDPDREGEAIAWHVMEAAEMDPARTKRVVFQEITQPAIRAAFEQPRDIDMDRVEAQQARRVLDRLVGYQLSPLLWRKIHGRLSAGRVQSVAVRLVVEREREIDAFNTEEYWTIDAELSQTKFRVDPRGNGNRRPYFIGRLHRINGVEPELGGEDAVRPHVEALGAAKWDVGDVNLGTRTRRPTAPFTTSTLQQEASRRLGLGTTRTMRIAQELYEGVDIGEEGDTGLITYMRTDSVTVAGIAQEQARDYIGETYGAEYLPDKPPVYKTRSKTAQEAHEAIRPTGVSRTPAAVKPHLSKDQYRLYKLIWERFVASQMAPAIYDTVSAELWAGPAAVPFEERPYLFRASGSTLTFRGFLAVYGTEDPDEETEQDIDAPQIPSDLVTGEPLDLLKLLPEQHFTQPPPRYSEASLVKALEENGIGRPSTYASIISTIQNRGYVDQEQKRLRPTEIGGIVNDMLVQYFPDVVSLDFTARMEDELDEIAEGKAWVPVIGEFYQQFAQDLARADEALPKLDLKKEPEYVGRDCPLSGHPLVFRQGRFGRFIGCSHYPNCRYTEQILVKVGVTCPNCGNDLIEKRSKRGRVFYGCSNYPNCEWTNWKKPLTTPCPVCNGVMVQENKETAKCTVCEHTMPIDTHQTEAQPAS